ncbi:hypothetical protein HDU91_002257, partial [Kappamyces sp. JEL0680]
MTCIWMEEEDATGEPLFSVTPKLADIPSKSAVEFKVQFRPRVDNEFYGKQLECFCYFKSMRNFRLVNEDTFTPPWCLTVEVAGNTFPPGEDTFIPKIDFGRTRVVFPPCYVDRSEYQTVKIANAGDTTVKFSFLDNTNAAGIGGDTELSTLGGPAFSVKPRVGVLKKNESRLIVFRFSPSEKMLYEQAFTCYFNNSVHSKYDLQLNGFGAYPEIVFSADNSLTFKPTYVGSLASRSFPIRNRSKAYLHFEWQIPKHFQNIVSIDPLTGFLDADETMELQCTFAPNAATAYNLKIPCYYYHEKKNGETQRSTLYINGRGAVGSLTASPDLLDFSNVLINTTMERDITLFNPSDCDINFTLGIKKLQTDQAGKARLVEIENDLLQGEVQIFQKSKILPARSNETIRIRTCLRNKAAYEFHIYYKTDKQKLAAETGAVLPKTIRADNEHYPLAVVRAAGVHPVMAVQDIRSDGFSKTILWQLFSIDRFNELLGKPADDPLAYTETSLEDDTFPTDAPPIDLSALT